MKLGRVAFRPRRTRFPAIVAVLVSSFATVSMASAQRSGGAGDDGLPLEPAGKLEFTTDEGTWLSVDVFPDGESLVFDLLGDLYTLPIDGGTATRITEGMGFDSQPRVSPDGEWIAFVSDRSGSRNLWIARADGTEPRKLSSERRAAMISPAWTPDSQYVIVTRREARAELRMYHVNGGSGLTVGPAPASPRGEGPPGPGGGPPGPTRLGAAMSPDGHHLYFSQSGNRSAANFPSWQIGRMEMRSGDVDLLTQAEYSAVRPALSPDGRHLVYATRHETRTGLRVRDLESGADRWLIWPVQRDEIESGGAPSRDTFPSYAFTPDGESVVATAGGKLWRVAVADGSPSPIPFTADVGLDIGPELEFPYRIDQGPVRARLIQDPQQSPDGERVAMSVLTKIYVMDSADGSPRRLTSGDAWEFKPAWSPDGEWIAYVTWSMSDGGQIWRMRADGSASPEQLSEHRAFYTDVVYSPDGTRIVGLRGNEYTRHQTFSEFGGLRLPLDLIWLPAAGGDVELIVPARGLGAPHFASDSERIFVYSRDGLISLRYDGTDRQVHLKVTGPSRGPRPGPASRVLLHPGGDWALAAVNNQLWVVAVPRIAGEPTVSIRNSTVPVRQITDIGADYFAWADGGNTITWAIGSTFYRRALDSIDWTPKADEDTDEGAETSADSAASSAGAADEPVGAVGDSDDASTDAAQDDDGEDAPHSPRDDADDVESIEIVLEFPRAVPTGSIVLRGGTAITMQGDSVIEAADIVVTDNRIVALGPRGQVELPDGARQIDIAGTYVIPGMIDTHAHWEFRTHDVLEPQNWSLIANLAYGVTTGLDVQTTTNDYLAYQDLVETGQSIGQRALMTGPGVFSTNDFQSYEATLDFLRRYARHYRTRNIKSYMVGNRQQRQWVVKASKELGLIPTTEGGRDLALDMTHAIDGMHGNEHTLPVTPLFKDVVELFARTLTAYTPTLLVQYGGTIAEEYFYSRTEVHDDAKLNRFYPHNRLDEMSRRRGRWIRDDEFSFDEAAADAAKIQRAGGLVGVGGHGQLQGLGYHWEMWALGMGGMTPREVLQAATIDGARIIGVEQDLGSLEAGKLADLVVLDADPLADIHNTNTVRWVMKNGELYDGDTLNQVWPVEKELPPFWWWDAEPREARITKPE